MDLEEKKLLHLYLVWLALTLEREKGQINLKKVAFCLGVILPEMSTS